MNDIDWKKEILLIDKPKGISSFDVIRKLRVEYRKLPNEKQVYGKKVKIGHSGTLDPLATGLMVLGIGKGTKKLTDLIKLDKVYKAEIVLGESRTTGDMEGEIIDEKDIDNIDKNKLASVLKKITGKNFLPVPIYSAIKKGGEPLYKKARRGENVDLPIKEMTVTKADLEKIEIKKNRVHLYIEFHVESGTYIRSIAVEIGNRLNIPATLGNLRRTKVGSFEIKNAINLV